MTDSRVDGWGILRTKRERERDPILQFGTLMLSCACSLNACITPINQTSPGSLPPLLVLPCDRHAPSLVPTDPTDSRKETLAMGWRNDYMMVHSRSGGLKSVSPMPVPLPFPASCPSSSLPGLLLLFSLSLSLSLSLCPLFNFFFSTVADAT